MTKIEFTPEDFPYNEYKHGGQGYYAQAVSRIANAKLADIKAAWLKEMKGTFIIPPGKNLSIPEDLKAKWLLDLKADSIEVFGDTYQHEWHTTRKTTEGMIAVISSFKESKFRALIPRCFIEEISKKPCEHMPKFEDYPSSSMFECAYCGVKLKAKWEVAE